MDTIKGFLKIYKTQVEAWVPLNNLFDDIVQHKYLLGGIFATSISKDDTTKKVSRH